MLNFAAQNCAAKAVGTGQKAMIGVEIRAHYDREAAARKKDAIKVRDEKGRAVSTPANISGSGEKGEERGHDVELFAFQGENPKGSRVRNSELKTLFTPFKGETLYHKLKQKNRAVKPGKHFRTE